MRYIAVFEYINDIENCISIPVEKNKNYQQRIIEETEIEDTTDKIRT